MRLPVDMHQGELFVETRIGRFALVPVSDREFVVEDMGQRVRFASPGAGKPAELVVEPLWIRGAQALIRKGEHREAVNALGRLAGYLPNSAAVREALGDAYLASGDRAGAAASYRESLRLEPGRRGLQEKLGKTAEKGP